MTPPVLTVRGLRKAFTLHLQGGTRIPVLDGLDLDLRPGECLVLTGPSGAGKSMVLKLLYGSYRPLGGSIRLRHDGETVELIGASPASCSGSGAARSATSASSCASCRGCRPSTSWPSRW